MIGSLNPCTCHEFPLCKCVVSGNRTPIRRKKPPERLVSIGILRLIWDPFGISPTSLLNGTSGFFWGVSVCSPMRYLCKNPKTIRPAPSPLCVG